MKFVWRGLLITTSVSSVVRVGWDEKLACSEHSFHKGTRKTVERETPRPDGNLLTMV